MPLKTVKIEWSIKGYHAFRVQPIPGINLIVETEENNRFDPHAMKVLMPPLSDIPAELHTTVTNTISGRPLQTVADIAGHQVGRVPANLCRAMSVLKTLNLVTSMHCTYSGTVGISANPPVHQRFRRGRRYDQAGGGAELSAIYWFKIPSANFTQAMHIFEEHVPAHDLDMRLFA